MSASSNNIVQENLINPRKSPTINPLPQAQIPHSSINARAQATYVNKNPNYVDNNNNAGKGFHRIVQGLSVLEPALTGWMEKKLERDIDEGIAIGTNIFTQSEESQRFRLTFKEYTQAHPEYINDNPFVWKGWEKARLNSLALDYEKGLQDFYTNSNLQNELDFEKVKEAIDTYNKTFREEHGLDAYQNPLDLAEHFTQYAVKSRANLMMRHTEDIRRSAETRLINATLEKTFKQLDMAVANKNAPNQPNIHRASQRNPSLDTMYQILVTNLEEAALNGVSNTKLPQLYAQLVFTAYAKYGENPAILTLLDREIQGVRPSSLPDVAGRMEQEKERRAEKAHRNWQRAREREAYNRQEANREAEAFSYRIFEQFPNVHIHLETIITPDGETLKQVFDKKGYTEVQRMTVLRTITMLQENNAKSANVSPEYQNTVNTHILQAQTGQITLPEAIDLDNVFHTGGKIAAATYAYNQNMNAKAEPIIKEVANNFYALLKVSKQSFLTPDMITNYTIEILNLDLEFRRRVDKITKEKIKNRELNWEDTNTIRGICNETFNTVMDEYNKRKKAEREQAEAERIAKLEQQRRKNKEKKNAESNNFWLNVGDALM